MRTWRELLGLARRMAGEHEGAQRGVKGGFWLEIYSQQFFLAACGEEEHEVDAGWCAGVLLPRAGGC